MKKIKYYIFALPVALFPYILLAGLACLYSTEIMEGVFGSNGYALVAVVAAFIPVCGAFAVILGVMTALGRISGPFAAALSMAIKLVQIPAYIVIFVMGIIFSITVFGIPFVIIFVVYDICSIAMTGLVGACAMYNNFRSGNLPLLNAALFAVCQFIFCVDIVFAIIAFVTVKKKAKGN